MFVIRQAQCEVLGASHAEPLVAFVRTNVAAFQGAADPAGAKGLVKLATETARAYGVVRSCDVGRYIVLMDNLGASFDTDPRAAAILRDGKLDADEKLDLLPDALLGRGPEAASMLDQLRRKIEDAYDIADDLPETTPDGVGCCPLTKARRRKVVVTVAIQEAPRARVRLPRAGAPLVDLTLHAVGAHPGGGSYLWGPADGWAPGIVVPGVALNQVDVTGQALTRGATEIRVIYTTPAGAALATCWIDVVAPVVRPSADLEFGKVPWLRPRVASPGQDVTIDNLGDVDLTLDSVTLGGTHPGDFELVVGPGNGTVVGHAPAPHQTVVNLRFNPTTTGQRTAELIIASDDPVRPRVTVQLSGTGTSPRIEVDVVEAFGATLFGVVGAKLLTIGNAVDATADLTLTGLQAAEAMFGTDATATTLVLEPGQSTTVRVQYRPSLEREQKSTVDIQSNDPVTPSVLRDVVGIGIRPTLKVSKLETFGHLTVGQERVDAQSLRIENIGTADLEVGPFELTGDHRSDFLPEEPALAVRTLKPGEHWPLKLPFRPGARGKRKATLTFASNDPDQPDVRLPLEGTGLMPLIELTSVDAIADFVFGVAATTTITVSNVGDDDSELIIEDVGCHADHAAHFDPAQTLVGQTITKGQPKTFIVNLAAPDRGSFKTTLQIKSNGSVTPATAPIVGRCLRALLHVGVVPVFRTMAVGEGDPPTQTLTISNNGDAPLTVTSVTVPGGVFRLSSEQRGTVIASPGSIDVIVSATLPSAAIHAGTIAVVTSAGSGTANVEASAYGLPSFTASLSPISPGVDDADLHYRIDDPKGAVGKATITIHEIDHVAATIGKILGTFAALPHVNGDNAFAWLGAVSDADYRRQDDVQPFIGKRNAPYRVKITIARADDSGVLERTCDVDVANTGELTVQIHRADGAALATQAALRLTRVGGGITNHVIAAKGGALPTCDEIVVRGLIRGDYDVEIVGTSGNAAAGLAAYLNAQAGGGGWRIAPSQTGIVRAAVRIGERTSAIFQITRYTQVQFVGFYATPTGTQWDPLVPLVPAAYTGLLFDRPDMIARCEVMKAAMTAAEADHLSIPVDHTTLKVFMAPEFYFRGQDGGYPLDVVEEILPKLLVEAQDPKYVDWLFVYGTAIAYHRHGRDNAPARYQLYISNIAGNVVSIQRDPGLPPDQASTAAVCARIPANLPLGLRWFLRQGANPTQGIQSAVAAGANQYDLTMHSVAGLVNASAVTLFEPIGTEIFNVALVQRGGPNPGGQRDLLVYKDYVSSIDFLGRHHPDVDDDFYGTRATHRADMHRRREQLILPTEGSVDGYSDHPNPSVAGGTSEQNRSALGGGALFSMAGVNFGIEVCLDHLMERLNTYGANATPGDSMPQVHLIPSWGMTIGEGPIYAVPNGLVFNVDGRTGSPPEAGTFTGFRCPLPAHNGVVINAPRPASCALHVQALTQDWATIASLPAATAVPVANPAVPFAVNEQTILTRTVVTDTNTMAVTSDTTVLNPPNQPPIVLPDAPQPVTAPTTDTGPASNPRTRTWVFGPLTLTSVRQTNTVVVGTNSTETTTITTSRTGNVQGLWAQLFAQQGTLYVYPVQALPQAATV